MLTSVVEPVRTVANGVTLVRTVVAVALGCLALSPAVTAAGEVHVYLAAGYVVYWIGDILDGQAARLLRQETRRGAVFDICCDRACTVVLAMVFLSTRPDMWAPLLVFLVQFAVVDLMLSLGFLHWPIVSPNYFHRVDRVLWRWNWSPPAKTLNTAGVVVAVFVGNVGVALGIALAVLTLKIVSSVRMAQLLTDRPGVLAEPEAEPAPVRIG